MLSQFSIHQKFFSKIIIVLLGDRNPLWSVCLISGSSPLEHGAISHSSGLLFNKSPRTKCASAQGLEYGLETSINLNFPFGLHLTIPKSPIGLSM